MGKQKRKYMSYWAKHEAIVDHVCKETEQALDARKDVVWYTAKDLARAIGYNEANGQIRDIIWELVAEGFFEAQPLPYKGGVVPTRWGFRIAGYGLKQMGLWDKY